MSPYGRSSSDKLSGRPSSKDLEPAEVLEAVVFRESHTVPGTVKERRAAVFPEFVGIFSNKKRSANVKKASKLSKKWLLSGRSTVSPPVLKTFSQLQKKHSHKLLALMSGHYQEVELWTVILHCPEKQRSAEHGSLSLCFVTQLTAEQWYSAISERLAANHGARRQPYRDSVASDSSHESAVSIDETPRPSGMSEDDGMSREPSGAIFLPGTTSSPIQRSTSTPGVRFSTLNREGGGPSPGQSPFNKTWSIQDRRDSSLLDQELMEVLERRVTAQEGPADGTWEAFSCKDGLTGCVGFSGDNERALMLSYVVRAPPRLVVKVMLQDNGMGMNAMRVSSLGISVPEHLETVDPYTEFSRVTYRVSSLARLFLAPRDIVYKRSWRKEDDGTYVVLLSSVDHPKAPVQLAPWWHWFSPIRAHVESTGWTLTPLQSTYTHGQESGETLVTMVAKVDLRGWLSPECWLGRLMQPLRQGWGFSWRWRSFASTFLQQAEVLRTQAEAERFVLRPFLRGNENSMERHASRPATAGEAQPGPSTLAARSSMLQRLRTKSILECSASHKVKPDSEQSMSITADAPFPAAVADREPPMPHALSRILSEPLLDAESSGASIESSIPAFPSTGTCDEKFWSCPGSAGFKIRGPTYLRDHQKELSEEPLLQLASVDLLALDAPTPHIARFLPWVKDSAAPFTFLVQIMVPGSTPIALCIAWAAQAPPDSPDSHQSMPQAPIDLSLARFLAGGDSPEAQERRNSTFKLIPRVTEGSWIVKQSVGTTPCLMGRKLHTRYHRGERYMEVDIDVASSSVASTVVGMVQGATKGLVVDMGIVLEGHTPDELPERLLGSVRFTRVDMNPKVALDLSTGELTRRDGLDSTNRKDRKSRASRRSTTEAGKKAN